MSRQFTISGVSVSTTSWLTIELHPTSVPIQLHATSTSPLEVCPVDGDGNFSASGSSWPHSFGFVSCLPLNDAGEVALPASDGDFHLAFALRPIATSVGTPVTVTVGYSPVDTFVAVLPPVADGPQDLMVTYVPGTSTIGVAVSPLGLADTSAAPGFVVTPTQAGRALGGTSVCDFPTELNSCIGGVVPQQPVSINVSGPGPSKVSVFLAWK